VFWKITFYYLYKFYQLVKKPEIDIQSFMNFLKYFDNIKIVRDIKDIIFDLMQDSSVIEIKGSVVKIRKFDKLIQYANEGRELLKYVEKSRNRNENRKICINEVNKDKKKICIEESKEEMCIEECITEELCIEECLTEEV